MSFWALVAVNALLFIAAYLLNPRPKDNRKPGEISPPKVDPGAPVPVLWGRTLVPAKIMWFDGYVAKKETKKVKSGFLGLSRTKVDLGYSYKIRQAALLCWGGEHPVKLLDILFDQRFWLSNQGATPYPTGLTSSGEIEFTDMEAITGIENYADGSYAMGLYMPNLYGGKEQEGGIIGNVHFYPGNGYPTAGDPYMLAQADPILFDGAGDPISFMPAWHDLAYFVWRETNVGMTPSPKPWAFLAERYTGMPGAAHVGEDWDRSEADITADWTVTHDGTPGTPNVQEAPTGYDAGRTSGVDMVAISIQYDWTGETVYTRTLTPADGIVPLAYYSPIAFMWAVGVGSGGFCYVEYQGLNTVQYLQDTSNPKRYSGQVVQANALGEITIEIRAGWPTGIGFATIYIDDLYLFQYGQSQFAGGGMAGADIIWDVITNRQYGLGASEHLLDQSTFITARTIAHDVENPFPLHVYKDDTETAQAVIDEVMRTEDGVLDRDPFTGKLTYRLIRTDNVDRPIYATGGGGILSVKGVRRQWHETINDVTVNYTEPKRFYQQDSVNVKNEANIAATGSVRTNTLTFRYVQDRWLATRLALRALHAGGLPLWKGKVVSDRSTYGLMKGQTFWLDAPEHGIAMTLMRVLGVDVGQLEQGRIEIDCVEDAYNYTPAISEPPVTPPTSPPTFPGHEFVTPEIVEHPSQDADTGTVWLEINDPSGLVQLPVRFAVKSGTGALSAFVDDDGDKEQTVALQPNADSYILYEVDYLLPDGTTETLEGEVRFSTQQTVPAPQLTAIRQADGSFLVNSTLPAGATGIRFAHHASVPPDDATVLAAAPDAVAPYQIATPVLPLNVPYYVAAAATDGTRDSAVVSLLVVGTKAPAAGKEVRTANCVFINIEAEDFFDFTLMPGEEAKEITAWRVMNDDDGDVEFDIRSDIWGNFPPDAADSMVGAAAKPATVGTFTTSGTTAGWTRTRIEPGETVRIFTVGAGGIGKSTLALALQPAD